MKKIIIITASVFLILGITGISIYAVAHKKTNTEVIYKESTVSRGNLTRGISESGSITVDSLTQSYSIETNDTNTSSSTTANSGAASSSSSTSGNNNASNSMGSSTPSNSSASTASTSSSAMPALVVETCHIASGAIVSSKDKLYTFTADSIEAIRDYLQDVIDDASLTLTKAQLEQSTSSLQAKYSYNTSTTAGSIAKSQYDATVDSINNNITSLKAEIKELTSTISSLKTQISETQSAEDKEKLENELSQSQNQLKTLNAQLETAQSEKETKLIQAKQTYEESLMNSENASATYSLNTADLASAVSDASDTLSDAKAALEEFNAFIGNGTITADYSGTIISAPFSAGDSVTNDSVLVEYANPDSITISVDVTEDDIATIALKDAVNVDFIAYEGETYSGIVSEIGSATSDSQTVSYPVTILLTSHPDKVLTGMSATVTFIEDEVTDVLYVSKKAILTENDISYVYIMDNNGNYTKQTVTTGFSDGVNIEIKSGLEENETIYIEGKVSSN